MYLMNCIKPDIVYAISKLSGYTSNPRANHWVTIIRVLRYLRYTRYPAILERHGDANWISDSKDSKSTSGYEFTLRGAATS